MRHTLIKIFTGIIIFCSAILIYFHFIDGTILFKVTDNFGPRVYQTIKPAYTVGDDVVVLSSKFCKFRPVPVTVYWQLIDDVSLSYPPKESHFATGCYSQDKIEIGVLPGFIGNHDYKFVGKVVYHMPGRDILVDVSTNYFYVSPK